MTRDTTTDPSRTGPSGIAITWRTVLGTLTRPYRVTVPMVVLVLLVPAYLVIAGHVRGRPVYAPAVALDGFLPLMPTWALVYGALYAFLIVLPVLVLRQSELINRTVAAYLTVWISSYVCFLLYPTVAPRPDTVVGQGFAVWGLQFLYDADPPYNCFPSIHVAHSFVSALACYRVHRTAGQITLVCAALVAISTLFTKQHYVADVAAGIGLAYVAYAIFLRKHPRDTIPELDRRLTPPLVLLVGIGAGLAVLIAWVAYQLGH